MCGSKNAYLLLVDMYSDANTLKIGQQYFNKVNINIQGHNYTVGNLLKRNKNMSTKNLYKNFIAGLLIGKNQKQFEWPSTTEQMNPAQGIQAVGGSPFSSTRNR